MMILEAVIVMGFLGLVFGIIIALVAKKYSTEKDPRVKKILEALPGLNCGACGFASCEAVAEAIVKGDVQPEACLIAARNEEMLGKIKDILRGD